MAQLFVEPEKIARARQLAEEAARGVQSFIDRHSTVAIERTVLRLLGIGAAGARGAPLSNLLVDKLRDAKVLHKGAAYWLGRALKASPGRDPLHAIERIAAHPEKLPPLPPAEDEEVRETVRADARAAVRELRERVEQRNKLKESLRVGSSFPGAPWKYVIVATGNIHDDVEQAKAAAEQGADVIAVIRSTAQSLLDYVPHGATTEGYGGTYATQENFRIMREALDDISRKLGRYVHLTNYSSGLCMPEIAYMAAAERLDMLLNDAMYGILFRDINMRRTFCDQYFSRRICAFAGIVINTGEDNYITTADADEAAHTVIASQLVNEAFAHLAGMPDELIGFGHSFEIDPAREDTLLREFAMATMVRELFPHSPIKYMPPTKHKEGDIFFSHAYDVMSDLVAIASGQRIQLLGMMTEAMHNPFLMDRYVALKSAAYVYRAARHLGDEITFRADGIVARRQREIFDQALALLEEVARDGMMTAIGKARFGDTARSETGGKGLEGVFERASDYFNPFLEILEGKPEGRV
ncbi:MAG TPA: lysine 5,6-aminomutase subunit alpha [Myxococcales bacterium]|nr:lysine 5,6-aminomutase subunit alpha [Myxococcales bacterium]